jgi:hypothetical protein
LTLRWEFLLWRDQLYSEGEFTRVIRSIIPPPL